jgi:dGTP triphosphohydrolase
MASFATSNSARSRSNAKRMRQRRWAIATNRHLGAAPHAEAGEVRMQGMIRPLPMVRSFTQHGPQRRRAVADYIAGMTDRYALEEYKKLFDPYERV